MLDGFSGCSEPGVLNACCLNRCLKPGKNLQHVLISEKPKVFHILVQASFVPGIFLGRSWESFFCSKKLPPRMSFYRRSLFSPRRFSSAESKAGMPGVCFTSSCQEFQVLHVGSRANNVKLQWETSGVFFFGGGVLVEMHHHFP